MVLSALKLLFGMRRVCFLSCCHRVRGLRICSGTLLGRHCLCPWVQGLGAHVLKSSSIYVNFKLFTIARFLRNPKGNFCPLVHWVTLWRSPCKTAQRYLLRDHPKSLGYVLVVLVPIQGSTAVSTIVNPRKLEHGFRMINAGIPYTLP